MTGHKLEKILWSIALPGFGQILNGKLLKGFLFIVLEFIINVRSRLNEVILLSFQGDIQHAIQIADYEWLMFYPCVYLFAIWDAYRDAGGGTRFGVIPMILGAYIGTVGVVYSPAFKMYNILFGPVWLGILGFLAGLGIGWILKRVLERRVME
jgi:hypothetical protein